MRCQCAWPQTRKPRQRVKPFWDSSDPINPLEDEFFFVVEGKLFIDLEDQTVALAPKQGFTVPRGVLHRTRAPERTVMLMMMEGSGVVPTGD